MSYLAKLLVAEENVVHQARRSIVLTFGGLLATEIALVLAAPLFAVFCKDRVGEWFPALFYSLVVLAAVPVPMLLARLVWWRNKVYVVTNLRVLKLEGILAKAHRDASLDQINDLVLQQSLLGRLLKFGDLQIQTANEASGVTYHRLHDPVEFKRQIVKAREGVRPVAAPAPASDPIAQLDRLGDLRDRKVISEEEFEAKKRDLMDRIG